VAIDRDAILKQADKLLRQGKLEGAIAEYVRLVEDQPQDWNSINALGDLYVRAGKPEKAIEQYIRIADHQFSEGFFPKSAALYKKALKLQPDHEHILLQLASIGERQGKFVDVKQYLRQVAKQRDVRGESRGAAECILRLGSMPEGDVECKVAGAHAAQEIGDAFRAVELMKEAAHLLEKQHKHNEALQVLADAAEMDPFDTELRIRLAREFLSTGQVKQARVYLNFDTAGDDVELLLTLATLEFADGREEDARVAMARVLALAADREPDIARIADELLEKGRVDSAFACIDAITDAVLLQGDIARAAGVLDTFAERSQHMPALTKLVAVARDAGMSDLVMRAQAALADACLSASRGEEARDLAEALVRSDPESNVHADRLRRALLLLAVPDVDDVVGRLRTGTAAPNATAAGIGEPQRDQDLPPLDVYVYPGDEAAQSPSVDPTSADAALSRLAAGEDEPLILEMGEIDLSSALTGLTASAPVTAMSTSASVPVAEPPDVDTVQHAEEAPDIEDVFAQMRARSAREQQASDALKQYEEAVQLIEQGLDREAIAAFEAAARVPMMRFKAASRLGRFLIDRGDLNEGVEWLERASEAPPPSPDEGYDLLYELAGALEAQGESARALAVLMELDAEAEGYRDVRTRIMYLSRVQQTESQRS
jgi:tetratricopeptide (TPR) repeat protein